MKISVIAIIAILSLTFVTGCIGGAGGVQGVLDAQCNAMKSKNVDAYLGTFEASVTNPEWTNQGKPMVKSMFELIEIKECSNKIISQEDENGVIKAEVETTMKISAFGQTVEDKKTETRYFVEIDGKLYERGTIR